jgi:hypothetical protein
VHQPQLRRVAVHDNGGEGGAKAAAMGVEFQSRAARSSRSVKIMLVRALMRAAGSRATMQSVMSLLDLESTGGWCP